ncbi:hydrolase TatD [Planctomycetota bacterium]|jgi:TatD DNase family protein|nr:TatD family hydrolase [Planctomycetota bacterium]MSR39296.1 TatD family deoxyribonuclease [Planctomycetota bacterium]GDY01059.1 hydrolase TatD [Planctomycetota bacterium]
MNVFDTHCHLGLDKVEAAHDEHARAVQASVTDCVIVGIDLDSSVAARALANSLSGARWSAGLHPNDANQFAADWDGLCELAALPDCAAIGETGLDFFREHTTKADQQASLRAHLDLALAHDLPVILHCRDAFPALLQVLRERAPLRGVMHCFSGDPADAIAAVELGLHISFAAPLTYKKNVALREAAKIVPEARLLIETDAPFLPPQSRRGQRNEPAFIRETLQMLAAVRGWDEAHAAAVTHRNACDLFGARQRGGDA